MENFLSGMFLYNAYSLLLFSSQCSGPDLPVKVVYVDVSPGYKSNSAPLPIIFSVHLAVGFG